ncbi:MAG TPA: SRPBCC domain-containing protein [Longimicrobiales bacterium]|nr:SRPBCC domain-containing protein [Longimicrobiales bacterium]
MPPAPLPDAVCSIVIQVPVEAVWAEITKAGSVQRPLFNTVLDIDLRPSGRLRYSSPDRKRVFVAGEVLEVDPPRLLRHTYVFAMRPEAPTVVTWELTEVPEGTRVTLTHAGWTDAHTAPEKQAAGWRAILDLLKSELETGDIPARTKLAYAMQSWFMWALPQTTKASYADEQGW